MPIYEYQCTKCEKITEAMQKISDAPIQICAHCGGPVTKLVSRTSFQLKGTGWYATDYKKSSSSSADSKPTAPAETKPAETKPAPDKTKGGGKS